MHKYEKIKIWASQKNSRKSSMLRHFDGKSEMYNERMVLKVKRTNSVLLHGNETKNTLCAAKAQCEKDTMQQSCREQFIPHFSSTCFI